ncbi:GNAT family N-acetyltransferase [Natrinema soli]|uniref:GNAT family N-acetyltransferase n=1 Tax=Natrinema soli TaxID=1930624 RepID=A0ABD5SV91_9EURY|nr:GNAT family N-acetyltransferase [Natrinema soli]
MSELDPTLYRSIESINENQWNNVVTQSDRGTVYHRAGWIRAIEEAFDYGGHHVVVEKGGNPVALMPNFAVDLPIPDSIRERLPVAVPLKRLVSIPTGFGGPIVQTDEAESLDLLFESLETTTDRTVISHAIETYDLEYIRYGQYLQTRGYEPTFESCLFLLDLRDGWDAILDGMDKGRRRDIRKGNEQEYRIEIDPLGTDLETTYDWYVKNLERVDGSPLPKAFFEALVDHLEDRIRVFRAIVEGREIGRYVYLLDEEGGVLHHWLSAIPDADDYEYYPSELLHERAINWGIERGYDRYNFGKTGSHFSNSVFRFKHKYGGSAVPVFNVEKGYSRLAWPAYRFGRDKYVEKSL